MSIDPRPNLQAHSIWSRAGYMLVALLLRAIAEAFIVPLALLQLIITIVRGEPSISLRRFGEWLSGFMYQVVAFLTFATEELPFPFGGKPGGRPHEGDLSGQGDAGAAVP